MATFTSFPRKAGPVPTIDQVSFTSEAVETTISLDVTKVIGVTEATKATEVTKVTEVAAASEDEVVSEVSQEFTLLKTYETGTTPKPSGTPRGSSYVIQSVQPPTASKVSSTTTSYSWAGTSTAASENLNSASTIFVAKQESPRAQVIQEADTSGLKHGAAGNKLVIGIDFGTTYTGIAYGLTSDPTKIKVIKEWPGRAIRGRNDIVKIPTIIKYGPVQDNDFKQVDFDWGYKVGKDAKSVIRGFKLGLDPSKRTFYTEAAGIPAEDDMVHFHEETTKVEMQRLFRSTVDIVADYIGAVYKHALIKVRKAELPAVANLPKQFVITVPAIWSDTAKSATLRAARLAHPDLSLVNPGDLVTEPEAAALYTLQDLQNRGLEEGDTFVLCDAGGGTVDLISYQITSLNPRMRVKEIVSATGGAVGSMMLNNRFERYLREILGDEVLSQMKSGDGTSFTDVMTAFDQRIKPSFSSAEEWDDGGDEDDEGVDNMIDISGVNIKDDPKNNVIGNTLTITGDVLEDIFNPLVTATENLVREQIEGVKQKTGGAPKCVLLVGGFGASPYLSRRLEEMVQSEQILVKRPDDAQAAIVKGAVLYKMPNTVQVISNVAPTSLGVVATVQYIPGHHPESAVEHGFIDKNEGIRRVPEMTWFIIKGDDLNRNEKIRFPCYRDIPFDYKPENLIFEDELSESNEALPPQFPWEGKGVRRKCVVTSDLGSLDGSQLVRRKGAGGSEYYSVDYELVVTIQSAIMTFAVECQGKSFGMADVEFR